MIDEILTLVQEQTQDKSHVTGNEDENEELTLQNVTDIFKLPIDYRHTKILAQNVIQDLEISGEKNIYNCLLNNEYQYNQEILDHVSSTYTTDKKFLKDSYKFVSNVHLKESDLTNKSVNDLYTLWQSFKTNEFFKEKYQYVSWDVLEFVNKSPTLLACLSYYNLSSPVLTLVAPIVMLFIPFIIIHFKGIPMTMGQYMNILKITMRENSFFKIFFEFSNSNFQEKTYMLMSLFFYCIQIYQNIQYCIQFYRNMTEIIDSYKKLTEFIQRTLIIKDKLLSATKHLGTYSNFNMDMNKHTLVLQGLRDKLQKIYKPNSLVFQLNQIGYIMHINYELYNDETYHQSIMYAIGLHGFAINTHNICQKIQEKKLCVPKYSKKSCSFKQTYYLPLLDNESCVKNDVDLKNTVITGSNGSGKTTMLKSILINMIMTQQFGVGCYSKETKYMIHDEFHSYLNIPDTSERDSLFQAEARRCKEILDCIEDDSHKNHFCIFDELYSGTNPEDAVEAGHMFLKYIHQKKNVRFMITTHYFDLCDKLKEETNMKLSYMDSKVDESEMKYTYKLKKGISKLRGGVGVLKTLNYPKEVFC